MPDSRAARWPPRLAYQVCECTRSAPAAAAAIDRSADTAGQRRVGAGQRVPRPVRHRGRAGPRPGSARSGRRDRPAPGPGTRRAPRRRRTPPAGTPWSAARPERPWPSPLTRAPPGPCRPRSPRPRRPRTRGPGRGPCRRPPRRPSGTTTFLSRIALRTTACRLIRVLCMITDRSTVAQLFTRTPGQSTDLRTSAAGHDHAVADQAVDRPADPVALVVHELGRRPATARWCRSATGRCTG